MAIEATVTCSTRRSPRSAGSSAISDARPSSGTSKIRSPEPCVESPFGLGATTGVPRIAHERARRRRPGGGVGRRIERGRVHPHQRGVRAGDSISVLDTFPVQGDGAHFEHGFNVALTHSRQTGEFPCGSALDDGRPGDLVTCRIVWASCRARRSGGPRCAAGGLAEPRWTTHGTADDLPAPRRPRSPVGSRGRRAGHRRSDPTAACWGGDRRARGAPCRWRSTGSRVRGDGNTPRPREVLAAHLWSWS